MRERHARLAAYQQRKMAHSMTDRLSPEARPDRIIRDLETWVREPYKGCAPLYKDTAKRLLTYIESLERLRAREERLRAQSKRRLEIIVD